MANTTPLENDEQAKLAEWLDWNGILWAHVPNEGQMGGKRGQVRGALLRRLGLKSGVPDVLVFDRPRLTPPDYPDERGCPDCVGVAIELKRQKGGRVSDEQCEWIAALNERGWYATVCKGADEAISVLESLGYGKRSA